MKNAGLRASIENKLPAPLLRAVKAPFKAVKKNARSFRWLMTEYRSKLHWKSVAEINAHRKTIKVYDIFAFFNELDLLEIRLGILDPYVDYFVIVEATQTFSGQPKPLYFKENEKRYAKWAHKIIHHVVDDVPRDADELRERLTHPKDLSELDTQIINDALTTTIISRDVPHWTKEFYIKESIKKALVNLKDEDICYVSDLDEVWNPKLIIDYSQDSVFKLRQTGYIYFLNNRTNEIDWDVWSGTIVTKYKNIRKGCLNHIRNHRLMKSKYVFLRNGGWHFGFQGGYEGAKKKIVESAHFWYNPEETLPNLEARIKGNQHFRGKEDIRMEVDERGLPDFLIENRERYKQFFK